MITRRALGLSGLALFATPPASAHHGFAGRYDRSNPTWFAGVVVRAGFSPPHPVVSIRVEAIPIPDLAREWTAEFTGPVAARAEDVGQVDGCR